MPQLFLDVDTQFDFVYPPGALAVPGAAQILPRLAALTKYAEREGIPLVSTCDAHLEDDAEFQKYRAHGVAGTIGASKAPETLLRTSVRVPAGDVFDGELPRHLVLEKRSTDMFTEPGIASVLERAQPDRFIVYGVVTEICVMHAVEGLLLRGKAVTLVSDAIFALEETRARSLLNHWRAAGCQVEKTASIVATNGNLAG